MPKVSSYSTIVPAHEDLLYIVDNPVGTPESSIVAGIGAMALRRDGGANTTLYVKESGTGNNGWVAK